jgi:hypothetical protein
VYGGRVIPRISSYISEDQEKNYDEINDYLGMFDISGMYVNIMKVYEFPYGESFYKTNKEIVYYNTLIKQKKYDELLKILPEFYICECDCQPNIKDLEPPIGRHENKRLLWDCKRRTDYYNSIDIKLLLRNGGDIFEIKIMLYWTHKAKIFEKWMNLTLMLKEKGNKMNEKVKGSGDALYQFGKHLGNDAYGQTIKNDHDDVIQFINNVNDQMKFMEENKLKEIITNDDDDEGYHVFIGNKNIDESKELTSRSRFLGSFVLSYSRLMLDNIVTCVYGEDRFSEKGIDKQIYTGDTDSIIIHCSLIKRLEDNNLIGTSNGLLADDLNKKFLKNGYGKIIRYCASAPKKYFLKYVLPNDSKIYEKGRINGISRDNCKFNYNDEEHIKITYDIFESMYFNTVVTDDNETCIKTMFRDEYKFTMPDKIRRINFKRSNKDKENNIPMFSIHSTKMERTIMNEPWNGRHVYKWPYTVPHYSVYCNK